MGYIITWMGDCFGGLVVCLMGIATGASRPKSLLVLFFQPSESEYICDILRSAFIKSLFFVFQITLIAFDILNSYFPSRWPIN